MISNRRPLRLWLWKSLFWASHALEFSLIFKFIYFLIFKLFGALINQTFTVLWKILRLTHSVTVGLCSEPILIFIQKKAEAAQARLAKLGVPLPGGKVYFSKQLQLSAGTGTWFIFACCMTSRLQSKRVVKDHYDSHIHTLKIYFDFNTKRVARCSLCLNLSWFIMHLWQM